MAEKAKYWLSLKLILRRGDEVLGLRARDDGQFAGYFDLPGGRVHVDEVDAPFRDVLKREVREEIGGVEYAIGPAPVAMGRHVNANGDIFLYVFFVGEHRSGEPKTSHEHIGAEWLKLDNQAIEKHFVSGILEGMRTYLSSRMT